jgi:hypothetical protein
MPSDKNRLSIEEDIKLHHAPKERMHRADRAAQNTQGNQQPSTFRHGKHPRWDNDTKPSIGD